MARIFRKFAQLLDVDMTTNPPADGDRPTWDAGQEKWVPGTPSGGGGAPTDATYLTATANGDLTAEVVVGATPGGELGGTWASPTVDATHSGSSHATVQAAAEATAAAALSAHASDTTGIHGIADTSVLLTTAAGDAAYQPKDSDLTALAALTTTAFGRGLLELANAGALLSAAGAQASDAELSAIAGLTSAADRLPYFTGSGTASLATFTSAARNLLDDADAATMRATLDLEAGTDFPSLSTFNDHSARHEDGGADEISLTGLSGAPADTINKAIVDAKGDLIAATAADTVARVAVGSDGQVLTADSGQTAGVKWAAAGGGYTLIQEIVAPSGGSANFDFTSISGSYRHLKLMFVGQTENAAVQNLFLRFNNDSAANYSYQFINGTNTTLGAAQGGSQTGALVGNINDTGETNAIYMFCEIIYYADTLWPKTVLSYQGGAFDSAQRWVQTAGNWTGTSAITRVTLYCGASDIKEGSRASLYGIT